MINQPKYWDGAKPGLILLHHNKILQVCKNEKKDNKQCLSDTPAVMVNEEN